MAINEATMILALLLQRFDFSVVPGIEIADEWTLTLRAKNGMPMYCTPRKSCAIDQVPAAAQ
jgi:cytochrome P450